MLHILAHTEAQEPASATTDQMGSSSSVPFSTSTAPTGALLFPLCFTNHAKVIAIHGDNLKELDAPSSTDLYFRAEQAFPTPVFSSPSQVVGEIAVVPVLNVSHRLRVLAPK